MAIPSTSNATELFVTQQPAWEDRPTLEQSMTSDITTSRSGLEQRQQRTGRSRFKLSYKAYLDRADQAAREVRARAEIVAPCWVPFWTERGFTATGITANTLSIDREWSNDFFTPGDWILFDSPSLGQQFRQIEDIGITDQELILYSVGSPLAFPALTPIYPCRLCVRENGQAEFELASEATMVERLTYHTL